MERGRIVTDISAFGYQNPEYRFPDEVIRGQNARGQNARVGQAQRTAMETLEGGRRRGVNSEQTNTMPSALLMAGGPAFGVASPAINV